MSKSMELRYRILDPHFLDENQGCNNLLIPL
jgi:hypothetical protein